MKIFKYLINFMILFFSIYQITAQDIYVPITEKTVNTILYALKSDLALKIKTEINNNFLTSRGTSVHHCYFNFKPSLQTDFYFKMDTKGTLDFGILGSSPFTIYVETIIGIGFNFVYDAATNKIKTNISSISVDKFKVWSSNFLIDTYLSFIRGKVRDEVEDLIKTGAVFNMLNNLALPALTINLPKNGKLVYHSITYSSAEDGLIVGLSYAGPLAVSISGPAVLNSNQTGSFLASARHGSTPYKNYTWYKRIGNGSWVYLSSANEISTSSTSNFSLKCTVLDNINNTAQETHDVYIYGKGPFSKSLAEESGENIAVPDALELYNNYPNPFNPSTTIKFSVPDNQYVRLTIYNLNGQKIKTLFTGYIEEGYHEFIWDGSNQEGIKVASGIYICELRSDNRRLVKKMIFTK